MFRSFLLKAIQQNNKLKKTDDLSHLQSILRGVGKVVSTGIRQNLSPEHKKQLLGSVLNATSRNSDDPGPPTTDQETPDTRVDPLRRDQSQLV